ncbi:MAG TPA: arginine--tRNA ligase, partial [Dehalococcoidia bacterium]|nr:arginine--tRNA ligase [Dehalococcoidia bacterium]
ARYRELFGEPVQFPDNGYPGDYVKDIAVEIKREHGDQYLTQDRDEAVTFFREYGGDALLRAIRAQLRDFGIAFDSFFSEKAMRGRGEVDRAMSELRSRDLLYSQDRAEWYRSTRFGDDKDRAVIKSDGELTYFASDIAYHRNKFARNYHKLINVWGADHQGHVRRMKAAVSALGIEPERLDILIYQLVTLKRRNETVGGGSTSWERIRLSKRAGEIITVRDVVDEVGRDACRFFFLARSSDAQMDFDVDLAQQQTADNPVYYVQYAHARIASVLEFAKERIPDWSDADISLLGHPQELELIRKMLQFPEIVELVCRQLAPHHFPHYSQDLATAFHAFYTECRVVSDDVPLSKARLRLCEAAKLVLARSLTLMGVSAPDQM